MVVINERPHPGVLSLKRPADEPILDPIDTRWIRRSIEGSFAQMYITLLSIIQGVALAEWAKASIPSSSGQWEDLVSLEGLVQIGFRVTTLVALVVVWHAYFWLAAIARWIPSFGDSLIVFLVGAVEFVAVLNMAETAWFYAFAVLGIVGGLAYWYHAGHLGERHYAKDAASKEIGQHVRAYKETRAKVLWITGGSFLLLVVVLDLVTGAEPLWDALLLVPTAAVAYLIGAHVRARTKTLGILGRGNANVARNARKRNVPARRASAG